MLAAGPDRELFAGPLLPEQILVLTYNGKVDRVPALHDINLTIGEAEFVSLLGPSGCGKTTLLKCLDGLISIDGGQVRVSGKPITGPGRDRAFVFQNIGLFPWRTVFGNAVFRSGRTTEGRA